MKIQLVLSGTYDATKSDVEGISPFIRRSRCVVTGPPNQPRVDNLHGTIVSRSNTK